MTLVGQCQRCEEKRRPNQPSERRRLTRGLDGEHLCPRHANKAWKKWEEKQAADGGDA